jgi:T4 RnlA family RNA ligase
MNYEFPFITNISDVLPAIEGRDEFVVAVKEGYTVINYNVMMADTFPEVLDSSDLRANHDHYEIENLHARLRRECRGIIFDTATGDIIRRPFHKFFNVNEREETQDHVVDLSHDHAILEKLDGSMIAPFIVNGDLIWGTKMGATDVAEPVDDFATLNEEYGIFARFTISRGYTPIFEWCSRKQRIVLDYKEDQLILTGIRDLTTGRYMSYDLMVAHAEAYRIPVVRFAFKTHNEMKDFVEHVRDLEDLEGFVVRFSDGHMLKLKCDWYVQIHKAKEKILQDRNIVELILDEKLDDVKAHLPQEDRDCLTQFESDLNRMILVKSAAIMQLIYGLHDARMDRKTFALEHAESVDSYVRPIVFKNFDAEPVAEKIDADVRNTIRNNLTKTVKYEAIRDAWFPDLRFN